MIKICTYCNKEFNPIPHDTNSKYCCADCRKKAYKINGKREQYLKTSKQWRTTHKERVKLYSVWANMIRRCFDASYKEFYLYGGRGIKVCDEWLGENGFNNFFKWAINIGYKNNTSSTNRNQISLDRINVNGNYEESNCRWVDSVTQGRNRRVHPRSKTGVSGVTKYKNKYRATIRTDNKCKHIGIYDKLEDAIDARMKAEELYWGKEYGYNRRNEK